MDYDKHFYILTAVECLRKAGSWTGKTHVQKALALTSCLPGSSLPFDFVLYKHGPYSFDLDQELEEMMSYDALQMIPQGQYGPSLKPGQGSGFPTAFHSADVADTTLKMIEQTAEFVGASTVIELESLATATWIRTRENVKEDSSVFARLRELKPHLAESVAKDGVLKSKTFLRK